MIIVFVGVFVILIPWDTQWLWGLLLSEFYNTLYAEIIVCVVCEKVHLLGPHNKINWFLKIYFMFIIIVVGTMTLAGRILVPLFHLQKCYRNRK